MLKTNNQSNKELDRAGRMILLAASRNDEAVEAAASSPFLFTRIRAAIAEAQRREQSADWLTLLLVARRAVPAMALIAILTAILMVWSTGPSTPAAGYGLEEEALSDIRDPGLEQRILARNVLSRDEVLSIVVDHSEREQP